MRADIDCAAFHVTGARDLVLRNHHALLKRSGLTLILKHLKLKINPENADLSSCYFTKSITNSFDAQNWNFLLSPSSRPISCTLSSYPSVKYFQLGFTMKREVEVDCICACVCSYLYLWSGFMWLSIYVYMLVNSAFMSPQAEMFLLLKLWG